MSMRALVRGLTAAAAAAGAVALGLTAPTAQAATPLAYVALGDSYSAGSGILPLDPTAPCSAPGPRPTTPTSSRPASGRSSTTSPVAVPRPRTSPGPSTRAWRRNSTRSVAAPAW